jgi:DNA-binding SARP family transcriptional activator
VVQFRILGSLEIADDAGRVVRVPPRERIVLAALLLAERRVVSVDNLVDAVWDERPPPTAHKQILICVSVLRKLLRNHDFRGEIVAQHPGYRIRLDDDGDRFDLREFEAAAAATRSPGEPAEVVDALRRALALWRGEPLAGIRSAALEAAAVALEERKLAAAEQYADLRLRLGSGHGLVEELKLLVAAHPTREPLLTRLMRALAQAGRKVEAAEVYRTARRRFRDQFGLEPGEELDLAMSAILAGSPAAPVAATTRQLAGNRGARAW